jgi:tRNA(fMet)-specific endonuclease VapC
MATYLLDTNVCIDALRDPFGPVARKFCEHIGEDHVLVVSSIVQYELIFGAKISANPTLGLALIAAFLADGLTITAFDAAAAEAAAALSAALKTKGKALQSYDALIAGHSMALGATLVTADARLAEAVSDMEVENWRV